MKFTVLYQYNLKEQVFEILKQNILNGFKFDTQEVNAMNLFRTFLRYPSPDECSSVPLSTQIQELEWKKGKLIIKKSLIVDCETVSDVPPSKALVKFKKCSF